MPNLSHPFFVRQPNHKLMKSIIRFTVLLSFTAQSVLASIPTTYPTGNGPANVSYSSDGRLTYTYETNGDTLPDFSLAGYLGGGAHPGCSRGDNAIAGQRR